MFDLKYTRLFRDNKSSLPKKLRYFINYKTHSNIMKRILLFFLIYSIYVITCCGQDGSGISVIMQSGGTTYLYYDNMCLTKDSNRKISLKEWKENKNSDYSIEKCSFKTFWGKYQNELISCNRVIIGYHGTGACYLDCLQDLKSLNWEKMNKTRILENLQIAIYGNLKNNSVSQINYNGETLFVEYSNSLYECLKYPEQQDDVTEIINISNKSQFINMLLQGGEKYLNMLQCRTGELLLACIPFHVSILESCENKNIIIDSISRGMTIPFIKKLNSNFINGNRCIMQFSQNHITASSRYNNQVSFDCMNGATIRIDVDANGQFVFYIENQDRNIALPLYDLIGKSFKSNGKAAELLASDSMSVNDTKSFLSVPKDEDIDLEAANLVTKDFLQKRQHESIDNSSFSSKWSIMWKRTIFFLLYVVASFLLIRMLKRFFITRITRENSALKSVSVRKWYYFTRSILKIILIIVGVYFCCELVMSIGVIDQMLAASQFFIIGSILLLILSDLSLPINFMTMRDFSKKNRIYILYLRGFSSDSYIPEMAETADSFGNIITGNVNKYNRIDPNFLYLSERTLSKALKGTLHFYSVGCPEELESPEGSKRIYLNNNTWQEDVLVLMRQSKYNFVCVNSKESCIWEIKQCNTYFYGKTIYFVDDIYKLKIVRERMKKDLPECLKSELLNRNHMVAYQQNGEIIVKQYVNTEAGISVIVREIFKDFEHGQD